MSSVVTRSKEGVTAYSLPDASVKWRRDGPCKSVKFSSTRMLILDNDLLSLYSLPGFTKIACFSIGSEWSEASVSPCLSYVALVCKTQLKIIKLLCDHVDGGKCIFTDTLASASGAAVLAPKWLSCDNNNDDNDNDDNVLRFARIGKNEVVIASIREDMVERQSVPIEDGQPAAIFSFGSMLFCFVRCKSNQQHASQLLIIKEDGKVARSFGLTRADRVEIWPNLKLSRFLVVAHADVDQSGKSYYGESFLSVVDADVLSFKRVNSITGPFHDVAWMDGDRFIALHGFMPAACSVVSATTGDIVTRVSPDAEGKPLIGSKNTIRCHPKSGLTALAGFGNLPGSVEIWRIDGKAGAGKQEQQLHVKVGAFSSPGTTTIDWLMHDQTGMPALLCATTHPRLRVDNQWRIYSWTGASLLDGIPFKELYSVHIVTSCDEKDDITVDEAALKIAARLNVSAKKAEPYRPPSLRAVTPPQPPAATASAGSARSKEEKVLKRLQERLDQITELKARRAKGEALEANQLDKIEREPEVRKELEALLKIMQK